MSSFSLPVTASNRRLASAWLLLGIAALALSGLYSILLVASRTPGVQSLVPWMDLFHVALVVHVDLSVVIWFLCLAGTLWSLHLTRIRPRLSSAAWMMMAIGTVLVAASPLLGASRPVLNNYVPVLDDPRYFTGLITLGAGFTLFVGNALWQPLRGDVPDHEGLSRYALRLTALTALFALLSIVSAGLGLDEDLPAQARYELLFWGGGHTLQYTWTLLLIVAWLWLASAGGLTVRLGRQTGLLLFSLLLIPALSTPLIDLEFPLGSAEHRLWFTRAMQAGGLTALPLMLVVALALLRRPPAETGQRALRAALYSSMILFTVGGVLGFLIEGVNVVIPAHYHGSIVGVTLAFMGLSYYLLPRLGFGEPLPRLATWQPWIYGGGQLLHILGLAWSGGYGVQRKTAGAAQGLEHLEQVAGMAIMGLGGLVAIIGGLLFVVIAIHSIARYRRPLD